MNFNCTWTAMLGALLLLPLISAGAVDDIRPMDDSTIRTEILRGARDAGACALKAVNDNALLADCAYNAHLRNLKDDTGTMAYTLGLFFESWVRAARSPEVRNKRSAERVARDFFYISKHHALELRLDVNVVCQVTGNNCDSVMPMWNEWKERLTQPMRVR